MTEPILYNVMIIPIGWKNPTEEMNFQEQHKELIKNLSEGYVIQISHAFEANGRPALYVLLTKGLPNGK